MIGDWLSLSEVSRLLGVHQSTVRSWADQGRLPVHRTQGGHRRFRRSEIELWLQAQRTNDAEDAGAMLNQAIRHIRLQVSEGHLQKEAWYQKLNNLARKQYRRTSRNLVMGLSTNFNFEGSSAKAEARALGYEYASLGRRHGLTIVEALHAFLFFRNALLDSILTVYEAAAIGSPWIWGDMLRKINEFTDLIMIELLENYDSYERSAR